MKLIPTSNRILVKPILPQARTSSIFRADAFEEEKVQGVIFEIGPGRITRKGHRVPTELQKGQIVFIGSNPLHTQEVSINGELFLLCPETSILATLGSMNEN